MDSEVERKLYAMLITSYCVDSSMPISPACPSPTPAVANYHGPLIAPVADRSVVFPPLYSRFCADLDTRTPSSNALPLTTTPPPAFPLRLFSPMATNKS